MKSPLEEYERKREQKLVPFTGATQLAPVGAEPAVTTKI